MVKIGDRIRIVNMKGEEHYKGLEGVIEFIDGINQLHGTWGGLAVDVHHKITLTELNVNDLSISELDNLEPLCRKCHNKETHGTKDGYSFDSDGNILEINF